uniref:protein-tyrosine-phosphatase n=1 Tax=Hirudo medicinalis TaxID=6421 RepID=O44328_HIRME|nr:receptor tyrosine phosphatase [Hirudo medicinalis]
MKMLPTSATLARLLAFKFGQSPGSLIMIHRKSRPPRVVQKVMEGNMATFWCGVVGKPAPEMTWYHMNRKLESFTYQQSSRKIFTHHNLSVLRVEPVKKRDEGRYECEAHNGVGVPDRVSFNLSVYTKNDPIPAGFPEILVHPKLGSVERYRSTVMACSGKGNPEPTFSWLKDFIPIEFTPVRFSVMPTGALQLLNSTYSYEGKYECIAENSHGVTNSQQATLVLKARRIPPHFSALPDNAEVVHGGSLNLTCIASGSPEPFIMWKRNNLDLSHRSNNHSHGTGVLRLEGITESANYTCHAISELGTASHVVQVKVNVLPKPPSSLWITEVSPNTVHLKWSPGNSDPVDSYIIRFRPRYSHPDNFTEFTDVGSDTTDHHIARLIRYTEYEFRVYAVNKLGRSASSTPVDVVTGELVPGSEPPNVRARPVSGTTVVVTMGRTNHCATGSYKGYKVYYTGQPVVTPVSLWTLHIVENSHLTTLTNLKENHTYTISVLAFTSVGDGPLSDNVQVFTRPGVPDQPTNFLGESVSSTSIHIQWDRPASNNIVRYKLRYMDSNTRSNFSVDIGRKRQDQRIIWYLLTDLAASTVYHMTLSAVAEGGEGPPTTTIQLQTHPYVLKSSPTFVSAKALNSTCVEVTWLFPPSSSSSLPSLPPPSSSSSSSAIVDGFNLYFSETKNFDDKSPHRSLNLTSDLRSATLHDLKKFTAYKIWVAGYNRAGEGPLSDVIIVKTEEDIPGEPKRVKVEALNSTSVHLEWKAPQDGEHNGDIKGYVVFYTELDENEEEKFEPVRSDPLSSHQTELTIGGLSPSTLYQFQVCAYTRKGDGDKSKSKKVKTKAAVPSPPKGFTLSLMKEENPIVLVTWQDPKFSHGVIEGYLVAFGVKGESHVEERRFNGNIHRFITPFLEKGATYEFKIAAKNAVGYGEYATEVITTPDGAPSGAPQNLSAAVLGAHTIRLHWDPPVKKLRHGVIQMYEVVYCESDDPGQDVMVNTTETSLVVDKLEADRSYTFIVRAFTSAGGSPWTNRVIKATSSSTALPAPLNIRLRQTSVTSMEVSWDELHGKNPLNVLGYRIYYSSTPNANLDKWSIIDIGPGTSAEVHGLDPSTTYSVRIRARGSDGRFGILSDQSSPTDWIMKIRKQFQVSSAELTTPGPSYSSGRPPRKPGVLRYKLEYMGVRKTRDFSGMEDTTVDPRKEVTLQKEERSRSLDELMSRTLYTFNISARFIDGTWGPPTTIHVETNSEETILDPPSFIRPLSDQMVSLRVKPAADVLGKVLQYLIFVVPTEVARTYEFLKNSISKNTQKPRCRGDGLQVGLMDQTFPRRLSWGMAGEPMTFSTDPFPKGHNYVAVLRAVLGDNKVIFSPYSKPFFTDPAYLCSWYPTGRVWIYLWIVAPICAAVVLILLLILVIIIARKRRVQDKNIAAPTNKVLLPAGSEMHPSFVDPVDVRRMQFQSPAMVNHPPIRVEDLATHLEALRASDNNRFSLEYESIDPGQQFTWEASNLEVNKSKNRYANVIAYDHSRVTLHPLPQASSTYHPPGQVVPGSDYINANFLDGFRKQNAYIATQGPMAETSVDFWRMVWERQSPVIVMMTKLEERGRVKCDQYWPSRGSESYGSLQVNLVDVIELATYTMRTFQMSSEFNSEKREVRHFQFTAWPDYGVPEHAAPLLLFHEEGQVHDPPDSGPIVVHCSAGVGRTGVFVVLDSMLERIKHTGSVDIYGHVTCLRAQRNYMVQTEDQYIFIHAAILEAVTSGNTEVPARNLFAHMQKLLEPLTITSQSGHSTTITGIEAEFKKLSSGKTSLSSFASANLSCNKQKNRLVNVLPYETTRVCLQPIRGVDGSDYINASFIDGYRYRRAYIATQGPLPDTVEDFWRALWESNCNIIVMLTKLREMGREMCHQYWPSERSARYQYFVVDPLAEYNMPQYILREFKVTDARDGQSRTMRQFQLTDWPEQGVPSTGDGFIDFIGQTHKTKEQFGQEGPIAVHCSAGVGRTGVFITLSIVLERMRFEGAVDVFQTVNVLRTQRPGMVQTEEQYAFCYRAALEYLGSFDHYTN